MKWVKGQSGNPKGRAPVEHTFAKVLKRQLLEEVDGVTTRERIMRVVVGLALDGNLAAAQWIVERVDGKAPDRLEVDATTTHALDDVTRNAILAFAARRRALERGA